MTMQDTAGNATNVQRRKLYDLKVAVRRPVPRDISAADAAALIAEYEALPKLGPLNPDPQDNRRDRQARKRRKGRS
jgi:hypothetical protein